MTIPTLLLVASTLVFLVWERAAPGRVLPHSTGWYFRSLSINFVQLGITLFTGRLWQEAFSGESLLGLSDANLPALEGFLGWFVGTFVFYWWHRLRHRNGWWAVFHQVHHSASRIEVLTSFYKHPVEILTNSLLTALILFPVLGVSLLAGFWYNFFAATSIRASLASSTARLMISENNPINSACTDPSIPCQTKIEKRVRSGTKCGSQLA